MDDVLETLRLNCGFDEPERWVDIARRYEFRRVPATRLASCPDCGRERFEEIGRYVYYSQLMRLQHCRNCDLVFSDVRLNRSTLGAHFEAAYKSDQYFEVRRALIFRRVRNLLLERFPARTRVLDAGGGKGHLARLLTEAGFSVTLNDRSTEACAHAREVFGLPTLVGDLVDIADGGRRFEVVLLLDVLYYLEELPRAWEALGRLVAHPGALMLRVPNRLWWIRRWQQVVRGLGPRRLQMRVRGFNPEHMYVFTAQYLRSRLRSAGFRNVRVLPSPPLSGPGLQRGFARAFDATCSVVARLTGGAVVASPSRFLIAER